MGKVLKVVATVVGVAALVIPGVGSVIGSALISVGVGAGVATAIVAGLGMAAFSAGLKSLAGAIGLGPKPPQVSAASTDRLQANVNTRASRKIVFGRTAANTDVHYQEFTGTNQDTLNTIVTLASHALESIDEVWFDDKLAWSSSSGVGAAFAGFLAVTTRSEGTTANAFTITGSSSWTASASRMVGNAYVWLRYTLSGNNSPFASAISSRMTFRVRGAKLYDPRRDSTRGGSGSHRADNQATWQWVSDDVGRNPALQLLWYLLGWRIQNPVTSQWKLAVGLGLPVDRINIASFMAAANICDEPVTLAAGGTEPRYRSDGVFGEDDDPKVVFDNLCAAMNGVLRDDGGQLALSILTNDLGAPVADFTEADVVEGFTWLQTPPIDQTFNIVRGQYIDASDAGLYQPVDYPDVVLTSPDGIDRSKTFSFALVQSASQAQRLAKTYLQRAQYPGTFSADFLASAWRCQVGSVVRLTFPALGFSNKLFRVVEHSIRTDGRCPMVLREENAAIYAWSASEAPAVTAAAPISYNPLNDPLRTGIADAAKTALWPNITGTGKPVDNADVTGANIAAGIAGQQDLATTPRAALPFGANLAVNSEFVLMDPTYGGGVIPVGWQQSWNGDSTNLGSVAFNDRRVQLKDSSYGFARDLTGAPNGSVVDCVSGYPITAVARYMVPVLPGERIVASARVGYQNCTGVYVVIGFFDENGTYVDEYGGTAITASIGAAAYNTLTRNDLALTAMVTTVPADGTGAGTGKRRWATIWTRFLISGSPTNPRILTSAPMIAKVPANQTAIPAYTPGPADRQASYGATTGTSLTSPTYGTLSDAQIKTDLGTAAGVVGQSAWATYASLTPQQVAQLVPNMIYNPTGVLGLDGWTVGSGSVVGNKGAYNEGYYFYTSSGSNTAPVYFYQDINIAAGQQYTISGDIYASGITVSTGSTWARVYIQWLNGSGAHISYSTVAQVAAGTGWTHVTALGQTAPAGAVTARVFCDVWGSGTYTISNVAWSKVKLQMGSVDTLFTDDASYGARYQSGVSIEALKPAQAGADVTGSNTAAGIAGQGDLATANRASLPFGANAFANSDMSVGSAGWEFIEGNNGGYGGGGGRNVVSGFYGRRNVGHTYISSGSAIPNTIYMFGPGMKGFWSGGAADVKRYGLPVRPGDRVFLGGKFSIHGGSTIFIRARFYDENGTLLLENDGAANIGNGRSGGPTAASGNPDNFSEQGTNVIVPSSPAGIAYVLWGCFAYAAGGDTSMYIFVTEPVLARIPSGQTTPLVYSPGPPDRAVDVTGENVAAAIVGQGTGATASTLAGLDAAAAAQLSALTAGSTYVAAVGSSFQMFLTPGQSVALSGRFATYAGGSSSGSLTCLLRAKVVGGSYSTFATGTTVSIGPTEPGSSTASGTFTNSTGAAQVFEFTVDATITPGTAGGGADPAKSYIKV